MQKTGLIIEAEVTPKGLNDFHVKRVFIPGEDWVENESSEFNVIDAKKWAELMVEGLVTVIYAAHDAKIKDSAEFLRETIKHLEDSFIIPAITNVNPNEDGKNYKTRS